MARSERICLFPLRVSQHQHSIWFSAAFVIPGNFCLDMHVLGISLGLPSMVMVLCFTVAAIHLEEVVVPNYSASALK